jgi:hypothetical protein
MPEPFDDMVALYRRILSERPRLVLLDNAASAAQVAAVLPPPSPTIVSLDAVIWAARQTIRMHDEEEAALDAYPAPAVRNSRGRCGTQPTSRWRAGLPVRPTYPLTT